MALNLKVVSRLGILSILLLLCWGWLAGNVLQCWEPNVHWDLVSLGCHVWHELDVLLWVYNRWQ